MSKNEKTLVNAGFFSIYKGFSCGDPTETRTLKESSVEAENSGADKFLTTKRF